MIEFFEINFTEGDSRSIRLASSSIFAVLEDLDEQRVVLSQLVRTALWEDVLRVALC
jgi:hypothetical protein